MVKRTNDTVNTKLLPCLSIFIGWLALSLVSTVLASEEGGYDDPIEIIEGEDRTIYEYRQNGVLTMIKIVPKKGRPYYMVPADGAPHYESLDHKRRLYPQWVIIEW
jgi:hypothetical protein